MATHTAADAAPAMDADAALRLYAAIKRGDFAAMEQLLQSLSPRAASVAVGGFASTPKGYTMLHQAAWHGNAEACQRLLALGADPSQKNCRGETAVGTAARRGHGACAEALERWCAEAPERGAAPPARRRWNRGETAAGAAASQGHSTHADALELEAGGAAGGGGAGQLPERIVCIGDVHGNAEPLRRLWEKLEATLGLEALAEADVVFLGDLCDRGPKTKDVFDFIGALRQSRAPGKTVVLAGNHDLGMAAFLGCLPADLLPADLEATKKLQFVTGFWTHSVPGGMHYQGRRWGGSSTYQAKDTLRSYGVHWGDDDGHAKHAEFSAAVPAAHKELLRSLSLVYDRQVPWAPGRVVCVHAGLRLEVPAEAQIEALKARDLTAPVLFEGGDCGRYAALSARSPVQPMHPDLEGRALLVSGHHGLFRVQGDRIIHDRSGGHVSKSSPLEALVLPERHVISST